MQSKVKIYSQDGKTRDERESCFPMAKIEQTRGQVRDDG